MIKFVINNYRYKKELKIQNCVNERKLVRFSIVVIIHNKIS